MYIVIFIAGRVERFLPSSTLVFVVPRFRIKTTIIELDDVLADINEEVEERQVRIYKEMVSRSENPNLSDLFQEEGMGEAKLYYDLRKAKARLAEAEEELKDLSAEREEADAKCKTALGITEKCMIIVRRRDGLEWDGTRVSTRWNQEQIRQQIKVESETLDKNRQRIESRGKSKEEVTKQTMHVVKVYKEKKAIVLRLEKTIGLLAKAMRQRMVRYLRIRCSISRQTAYPFYRYLQEKDAIGGLLFDHDRGSLSLQYQKDSNDPDNVCSDLMLLPERERSYVNLAALLTFGGGHSFCFRVMDGFDASTCAKIRNAALMQVVDFGGVCSSGQFILVTDQDLSSATISRKCRIHKMRPRRSGNHDQATLYDTVGGDVS